MSSTGAGSGRWGLVEEVAESVLAPAFGGVILYAVNGMGKSTVADHVARAVKGTFRVRRIRAEQSLTAVPYGALFRFLTSLPAADWESPVAVLRAVRAALEQDDDGDGALPILLIVDDLHHLDDSSSYLFQQLVMAGALKILALCRSWESQPQEFLALSRDGLLTAIELPPLTKEEVRRQVEECWGGLVAGGTVRLLMQTSGGNPELLSSLVKQAVAAGDMVQSNGLWVMIREPETVDPAVADVVKGLVKGLDSPHRRALELVALSGGLPPLVARQLMDGATLQSLRQLGLLTGMEAEDDTLRFGFPYYAAVVRTMVPAGRSLKLWDEALAAANQVQSAERCDFALHLAVWGLDAGRAPSAEVLLRAAQIANDECNYPVAHRLAAASIAGGGSTAWCECAWACMGLADFPAALKALEHSKGEGPQTAIAGVWVRVLAAQQAEDWRDRLARLADALRAEATGRQPAAAGSALVATYCKVLDGDYEAALARLEQGMPGWEGAEAAVFGTALTALCHAETGESGAAAETGAEALDQAAFVPSLRRFYPLVFARTVEAFVVGGRYSEAEKALQDYQEIAPARHKWFSGMQPALSGLLLFRQGRMRTALLLLTEAAETLRREDHTLLLPTVLGSAAAAATFLRDAEAAGFFRRALAAVRYGSKPARLVAQGLSSTDDHVLAELAAEARSAGLVRAERDIQEHRLLLGERSAVGRLAELTRSINAPDAQTLYALAVALQSPGAEHLEAAAEQAATAGKHMLAATALAYAAQRLADLGLRRQQNAVLQRLRLTLPVLQGASTPAIASVRSTANALTIRERQIAQLLCQGATNKQIAQALTLSPRTAEGHIYRIFLKLGVTRRRDLLQHPELLDV